MPGIIVTRLRVYASSDTKGVGANSSRRALCTPTQGGTRGATTWTTVSTKGKATIKRCGSIDTYVANACLYSHHLHHSMSGRGLVLFRRHIKSRTLKALSGLLISTGAKWKGVASASELAGRFSPTWAGTNASRMQREVCQMLARLPRSLQTCTLLRQPRLRHRRSRCQGRGSARTVFQVTHQGRPQRYK